MHQRNPLLMTDHKQKSSVPHGVWPVGLTAFTSDGCIDWDGNGQLLDWYVNQGAAGIFTICLSGEMYFLNNDERLGLAEFARARTTPEVAVVAAAGFGESFNERLYSIEQMADTGVDAVVVPICQLIKEYQGEADYQKELEKLLNKIGNIKLGLYECPLPYHRLLSLESLKIAADSNKVLFLKDTCCDENILAERLKITKNSNLSIFNANTQTNLTSSKHGAAGYSGTGANFFLKIYVELWNSFKNDLKKAEELQCLLEVLHRNVCYKYPRSAKYFLKLCGVDITDYCRWETPDLTNEDKDILNKLFIFINNNINY